LFGFYFVSTIRRWEERIAEAKSWKFKKLHRRRVESFQWLARVRKASPNLFAHWAAANVNG
jgi:hypothetical protein